MSEEDNRNVQMWTCGFCGEGGNMLTLKTKRGEVGSKCNECGNPNKLKVKNGKIVEVVKIGFSLSDYC